MKIAVLGDGVEGKSVVKYFGAKGDEVVVFDEGRDGVRFENLSFDGFDLVFRSPSVAVGRVRTDKMTSATRYFFEKCPAKIVGVTGTKGKGTTCSLIASILEAAGRKVWLVGNIGVSALDVLDEVAEGDVVVYELSSFQLWDMTVSPQVAVVVHMEVDHLDVHETKDDYWQAKGNIARYQGEGDVVIFDQTNEISRRIAELSPGRKIGYPTGEFGGLLDALVLPGEFNRMNGEAAVLAAREMGVTDESVLRRGLGAFAGLPHRLKFVREVGGVKYYDDSISTTPGSAIAAMRAFGEPKVLILGGSSKGADFDELAKVVREAGVRKVVLVGPEGERLERALLGAGYGDVVRVAEMPYEMKDVVKITTDAAKSGDVVILSPACASFDNFENYAQRGDEFIAAVEAL